MVFIYLILGIIILIGIILFVKSSNSLSVESDGTISKKITFNQNSWHFWYYSNVISKNPPKVLCPYYWCMVLLILTSPVLLPIMGIIGVIKFLYYKFKSNKPRVIKEYDFEKERRKEKIGEIAGKIFMGLYIIFIVGVLIICAYSSVTKFGWLHLFKTISITLGVLVVIILISVLSYYIFKGFRFVCLKIYKSNFIQVPKEMIVAIYKKSCPIIDWKE